MHIDYAEIVVSMSILYICLVSSNIFSHGNAQEVLKYGYFRTISTVEICFVSLF